MLGKKIATASLAVFSLAFCLPSFAQEGGITLKGGAKLDQYLPPENAYVNPYARPMAVQEPVSAPQDVPNNTNLYSGANQNNRPPQNLQALSPVQEALPPQFLGRWQVQGNRGTIDAQPQFQGAVGGIFAQTTSNVWTIQGSPQQGYMLVTDSGVQTAIIVQMKGTTAVLRYAHPIKNTVAQEALVMQLAPNGAQFEGLERITIVKEGEPPRAKVTYNLIGHRQ